MARLSPALTYTTIENAEPSALPRRLGPAFGGIPLPVPGDQGDWKEKEGRADTCLLLARLRALPAVGPRARADPAGDLLTLTAKKADDPHVMATWDPQAWIRTCPPPLMAENFDDWGANGAGWVRVVALHQDGRPDLGDVPPGLGRRLLRERTTLKPAAVIARQKTTRWPQKTAVTGGKQGRAGDRGLKTAGSRSPGLRKGPYRTRRSRPGLSDITPSAGAEGSCRSSARRCSRTTCSKVPQPGSSQSRGRSRTGEGGRCRGGHSRQIAPLRTAHHSRT